jgi:hypothetical protein
VRLDVAVVTPAVETAVNVSVMPAAGVTVTLAPTEVFGTWIVAFVTVEVAPWESVAW